MLSVSAWARMASRCTNGSTASVLRWIARRFAVNFPTLPSTNSSLGPKLRIGLRFMSKAVQFDSYGGIDVLEVRDVPCPVPGAGEVLVQVRAAGINPSEGVIRSGALHHLFPATFPSGQGSDLAGVVAELGPDVTSFTVGDEVIGFSMRRSSQAEDVIVPANQLTPRPSKGPGEAAGSLFVAGVTAYAAGRAVHLVPGGTGVVAELADLVARGELEVPIAGVFALDDVREAYRQLELRHTRGKLVLRP